MVRFLDNTSQGFVTTLQLMDYFKSECQKMLSSDCAMPSVSRKASHTEQQEHQQEEQEEKTAEDDKSVEENVSDPKLLSHSPAKPQLEQLASKDEAIDWDTYPLPEDGIWERRYDKRTGKVCRSFSLTITHPLLSLSSHTI